MELKSFDVFRVFFLFFFLYILDINLFNRGVPRGSVPI